MGGLAIAAYEHYSEQQRQGSTAPSSGPPPPPPGASATPPPPPRAGRAASAMPPPPPPGASPAAAAAPSQTEEAMLLIRAMISAAKADGAVDADEMQRVLGRLEAAGVSDEERGWVMSEMARPLDVTPLVQQATDPRLALEVYAASIMAIDVDTDAERRYLADLRTQLRIAPETAAKLHETIGVPAI
jgi:uncharacterized membrane protein YebE (DUF533 family)